MIESRYRKRTKDLLEKHGRKVLTFRDQISRGIPDTSVSWAHQNTFVEHKVLRRGAAYRLGEPLEVHIDLRRDTQLFTMEQLEAKGRALYLIHVEAGSARAAKYLGSLIALPSVVATAVRLREPITIMGWHEAKAWADGSTAPIPGWDLISSDEALAFGSLYEPEGQRRLLELL